MTTLRRVSVEERKMKAIGVGAADQEFEHYPVGEFALLESFQKKNYREFWWLALRVPHGWQFVASIAKHNAKNLWNVEMLHAGNHPNNYLGQTFTCAEFPTIEILGQYLATIHLLEKVSE